MAKSKLRCSMCGAEDCSALPVLEILPGLNMCCNCVEFIKDQAESELAGRKAMGAESKPRKTSKKTPKPHEIFEFLNQYVIGQEEAKKYLSVAVYNHYKRISSKASEAAESEVEIEKSNIIMVGPTGTGKTLLVRVSHDFSMCLSPLSMPPSSLRRDMWVKISNRFSHACFRLATMT